MEQIETAAAAGGTVARQLDFTASFNAAGIATATPSLMLPDHHPPPSKLAAMALSPPSMAAAQTKLPPRKMVMPPRELVGPAKSPALAARLAHPVNRALQPLMKIESPKSREKSNLEQNDTTPKKQKQCNCKNSRCLKLYCECFASGIYCDGCNCLNCHNKMEHEADRKESIDLILERNPTAFRPKFANSPHGAADVEHNKGCHCKKSGCLKRYCECFQANILCSDKCKCMDCKNFEGSEERKAYFHQYPSNSMAIIQQAANAAINGAIGTPIKMSRDQQIVFGASKKQLPSWLPQFPQENGSISDASHSPLSVQLSKPNAAKKVGLSKSSYRSPLDGILQLQHVNDFCTLLVEVSSEAAQNHSKEKKTSNEAEPPVASSHEHNKDHKSQENGDRTSLSESDGSGILIGRPLSPATLALMCDEQDTTFMASKVPFTISESNPRMDMKSVSSHRLDQLYTEQERLVLTRFRNFLNRIITCGAIEETKIEHEIS